MPEELGSGGGFWAIFFTTPIKMVFLVKKFLGE